MGAEQTIERGLGLHDYNALHYAHPLGRWVAPDTIVPDPGDPQSLNRYGYVLNNPLALVDPSGFCSLGPSSGGPDDRSRNMAYQSSCWGIYYSLLDQGIPGLNWQWDYGLGMSISNFATANFAQVLDLSLDWQER